MISNFSSSVGFPAEELFCNLKTTGLTRGFPVTKKGSEKAL